MYGDVNGDGVIDSKDMVLLAQYLAEWAVTLNAEQLEAADVYKDGVVDIKDAVKLAQYLAGWSNIILGVR